MLNKKRLFSLKRAGSVGGALLCGVGRRSHSNLCWFTSAVSLFSMQISKTTLIWPPVLSYYGNNVKKLCLCVSTECPSDHHRKLAYRETESTQRKVIVHLEGHAGCLNRNLETGKQAGSQANNHENVARRNRREEASLAAVIP